MIGIVKLLCLSVTQYCRQLFTKTPGLYGVTEDRHENMTGKQIASGIPVGSTSDVHKVALSICTFTKQSYVVTYSIRCVFVQC